VDGTVHDLERSLIPSTNVEWVSNELRNGLRYWNEWGELVLNAVGDVMAFEEDSDKRFAWHFYHDCNSGNNDDDEENSNDEGYDGKDYPFFIKRYFSPYLT
jgi:hypothetical protein